MTVGRLDRRSVLRGLGGALIALPALEACSRSRDATPLGRAEQPIVAVPAKRFIAIMCPDGVEPKWWFPTGTERDFTLARHNQTLAPIQQHLLLTQGIDNQVALDLKDIGNGNGHAEGVSSILTGLPPIEKPVGSNDWYNAGPSIDQLIMQAHKGAGYVGATDSLHFG